MNAAAPGTVHYRVEAICVLKQWPWTTVYTLNIFCFYLLVTYLPVVWPDCLYCCFCITTCLLQGVNVDFPPNKLKQGFGEHAVFVLDHLADAALKSTNFTWKK